jgi:hypothetical protein
MTHCRVAWARADMKEDGTILRAYFTSRSGRLICRLM